MMMTMDSTRKRPLLLYPDADVVADDSSSIDAALTRIAQQTPFLGAAKKAKAAPLTKDTQEENKEAAHYRAQALLLFADDEETEDDPNLPPHVRFERAHARLMAAPPSDAPIQQQLALVPRPLPPPSLTVRMAREQLGHDPLTAHIAGRPWTDLEWRAYGATHSYGAVRARVEQNHARLIDGRGVLRFRLDTASANTDPTGAGHRSLVVAEVLSDLCARRALRDIRFLTHRPNSKPDAPLTAAPFYDTWSCDPQARRYADVVFDPRHPHGDVRLSALTSSSAPPADAAEGGDAVMRAAGGGGDDADEDEEGAQAQAPPLMVWNTWPGLRAARLPPFAEGTRYAAERLLAPILEHLRDVVCDGDDAHAEWLLDYFAAIVQRPWRRTGVAVLLTGTQGAGKNTLLDFFRERVLGAAITSHLHDVRHALCGRFAEGADRVIFSQVDEAWFGRQQDAECVKHLITGARVRVERKFQSPEHRPNYMNLVATTNTPDAGLPVGEDRRWTFFRVSRRRVGDHAYFARLHAACADDAVARAFYDALMARPNVDARFGPAHSSSADGQAARPLTAHYLACRRAHLPPARRFLSALIHARAYCANLHHDRYALAVVRAADLYQDYVRYLADAGLGAPPSFVVFGLDLAQLMPTPKQRAQPQQHQPQPPHQAPQAEGAEGAEEPQKKKRRKKTNADDPDHNGGSEARPRIEEGAAVDRIRHRDGYHYRFHYARLRALLGAEYDPDAFLLRPPTGAVPF